MDGKRFLGWMVSAIVGGALEWRPHIQLTAPSGQGKSWLLREVLSVLMGPLLTQIVDAYSCGPSPADWTCQPAVFVRRSGAVLLSGYLNCCR